MTRLLFLSLLLFLFSCTENASNSIEDDEVFTLCEEPTIETDTVSFNHFLSKFNSVDLPYTQNEQDLWDGVLFYDKEQEEYDYESNKIPYHLMYTWLMDDRNELSESLNENAEWLEQDDDSWYMLQGGIKFTEGTKEYVLIHYYEKVSESNGAYWYSYFLEFDQNGNLIECLPLGKEGLYSFVIMEETELNYFWARHTNILGLNITINSAHDIKVCTSQRDEIDGDLSEEEMAKVNGTSVTNDSLGVWTEVFEEECIEF